MAGVSHQTIKLGRGKHRSPEEGACVMELASMLAGESFSDHPKSVCPVIGSFLRAYNDAVNDRRRQDLYAYATRVVGSHGSEAVKAARTQRLLSWIEARHERRRWTRFLGGGGPRLTQESDPDVIGARAVRTIIRHTEHSHAEALALIDELLTIGRAEVQAAPAPAPRGSEGRDSPGDRWGTLGRVSQPAGRD